MEIIEVKDKIKVMQAFVEGKEIQRQARNGDWIDEKDPTFDWESEIYRVKPDNEVKSNGQLFVLKTDAGLPIDKFKLYRLLVNNGKIQVYRGNEYCPNIQDKDLINVNDVLFYYEYENSEGEWTVTRFRYTSDKFFNGFSWEEAKTGMPVYALGFRLPRTADR